MAQQPRYTETFECTPHEARRARKAVAAFAGGWLEGRDATDFETAVGEALANVVEHGKCSLLTVDCWYAGKKVTAEIAQNGIGFEPPVRSRAPQRGAARGYGLFILRAVLDQVDYRENGTLIRLVKAKAER
jgi:anti-sigma regulatory factor (Ser/Thr protein kinase)